MSAPIPLVATLQAAFPNVAWEVEPAPRPPVLCAVAGRVNNNIVVRLDAYPTSVNAAAGLHRCQNIDPVYAVRNVLQGALTQHQMMVTALTTALETP